MKADSGGEPPECYQLVMTTNLASPRHHNRSVWWQLKKSVTIWYYDALGNWKKVDSSIVVEEYYDLNSGVRYSEYREGTIDLELTFVTSYADFNGIASQGEIHLLYMPFVGTEESDETNKKCSIEREDEYSLNGWTLHDLVFR